MRGECVDTPAPSSSRLDELLLISRELRRLRIAQIVDERVPADCRSLVTHGQCIEGLVAAILLGTHTLYSIADTLEEYDLELAFGWSSETAGRFHDTRVGAAMDAVFEAGVVAISHAALLSALKVHDLDLGRLHLDTTSVSVYGEYTSSQEPADPEAPQAIPHVTRGHSKDKRGDLKQIVYGITVSADAGIPVFARAASGNRADVLELRFMLEQIAKVLPEPRGTTLVGDSKFFSGETLMRAQSHGMHVVTMLPRNANLWGQAFQAYRAAITNDEPVTIFKAVYPDPGLDGNPPAAGPKEPEKEWIGRSFDMTYTWDEKVEPAADAEDSARQQQHDIPLRVVVVESSTLREQRAASAEGRRAKERARLDRAAERLNKREFTCEPDAARAADVFRERNGPDFHVLQTRVVHEERPGTRGRRGRPRAGEAPPMETVWRVCVQIDADPQILEEAIFRESCYVLVTTLPREGAAAATDKQVFDFYREQNSVEAAIRWAKNPLVVAPVFLKTEARIAALGLVYVLALMTYSLIQRHARARLLATRSVVPGNRGVTDNPTTEVLFRLFQGIDVVRTGPGEPPTVTRITQAQLDALRVLEHPLLKHPGVRFAPPRESGRPRDRAYEAWRQGGGGSHTN
jgi:transposase